MEDATLKLVEDLKRQVECLSIEKNERDKENDLLREQTQDLLRPLYGRKSECFEDPNQLTLFKELGLEQFPEP